MHQQFLKIRRSISTLDTQFSSMCLLLCVGMGAVAFAQTPSSFDALSRQAQVARDKGDSAASIRLYEKALALKPGWQEGWWYLGSQLYDQNEYPRAENALKKLVVLNPQLGDAWALLGLSEFETHDLGEAFEDLEKAKALGDGTDPSIANVVDYHLALLMNLRGESDAARILLSSLYLHGVRSEDLGVALGLALLRVPILPAQLDPSRDALVHDAGNVAALIATRQFSRAKTSFDEMIEKYPKTAFLHYAYGAMLASQGQDEAAEEQFRLEVQANPESVEPYAEWGFLEYKAEHYDKAIELAQKAVGISDNAFMAQYVLGISQLASGDAGAAEPHLVAASKLAPESPEIHYSLSRAYAKLGKPELARQEQQAFLKLTKQRDDAKKAAAGDSPDATTSEALPSAKPN